MILRAARAGPGSVPPFRCNYYTVPVFRARAKLRPERWRRPQFGVGL